MTLLTDPNPIARIPPSVGHKLAVFAGDIKIQHTVFALPFALLATFMAAGGLPRIGILVLILICMVSARTVAMGVNRLLDARLDALNPRTAGRAIPSGTLSEAFYRAVVAGCAALFVLAAAGFEWLYHNPWPLALCLPVLAFLSAYPFLKRFTRLCHYWLGASLALAPVCAWVAVRGDLRWPPILMFCAVLSWTAGFDIIYACQDYAVDVRCGLFSVPAKLGIRKALWVSTLTHVVSAASLILLGFSSPQLGLFYFGGAALAIALLIVEHALVFERNLSRIGIAFFTLNGILSVAVGACGIADVMIRR